MRVLEVMGVAIQALDQARDEYHQAIVQDAPTADFILARIRYRRAKAIHQMAMEWVKWA